MIIKFFIHLAHLRYYDGGLLPLAGTCCRFASFKKKNSHETTL
jgi:hypothetical protein